MNVQCNESDYSILILSIYRYVYCSLRRIYTVGPMILAAICVAVLMVKEVLAKQQNASHPSYTRKQRNLDRRVILIVIGFLFFSPTSIVVLQTFVCETFEDGTQALVADSSIECYTPTHIWSILYAAVMVFVYPIGTCLDNE